MVMMANFNLPLRAVRMQIASAVNLIVHIERMRDGIRRVQNISEIAGIEGETITMRELFTFQFRGERRDGTIGGDFVSTRMRPDFLARAAQFGLSQQLLDALELQGASENVSTNHFCRSRLDNPIRGGARSGPPRRKT